MGAGVCQHVYGHVIRVNPQFVTRVYGVCIWRQCYECSIASVDWHKYTQAIIIDETDDCGPERPVNVSDQVLVVLQQMFEE